MIFQKPNSSTLNCSQDVRIRKSDRRKILTNLERDYPELATETSSYNTFLQDVMTSSDIMKRKFSKDLSVYLRLPNDVSKNSSSSWIYNRTVHPIFVELVREKKTLLVPCLSILSSCPVILPKVYIHPGTSKFICRGANLMLAGTLLMPQDNGTPPLEIGKLVSISVVGNPTPFAAGVWRGNNDGSGIAVDVITCYGDDLWRIQLPKHGAVNETLDEMDDGNYGNPGFKNGTNVEAITTESAKEVVVTNESNDDEKSKSDEEECITNEPKDAEKISYKVDEMNLQNDLLIKLFYRSLLGIHDTMLPMPVSTYYAKHLKPILQDNQISGLEQTSHTKLSLFFQFLKHQTDNNDDAAGFYLSEDRNILQSIDRSHHNYRHAKKEFGMSTPIINTVGKKRKVQLINLYIIPNHFVQKLNLDKDILYYDIQALHAKNEKRRGSGFLTASESRDIFLKYCQQHNLDKQSCIAINEPLQTILSKKSSVITTGSQILKKDAIELFIKSLHSAYAILIQPQNLIYTMKRGKPQKIRIEVEKRGGGNKKFITRVFGLEGYSIDARLFSDDISKRFACSSTALELPSVSNKKHSVFEVSVQGYLAYDIQYLLTSGEEGKISPGYARKDCVLQYDQFFVPKGVIDIFLKKGVPKKK